MVLLIIIVNILAILSLSLKPRMRTVKQLLFQKKRLGRNDKIVGYLSLKGFYADCDYTQDGFSNYMAQLP